MISNIGEKIRKVRKERKMTQAELAGDVITRNMLSLIENGSATPSIHTLEYIAQRLDVSPGYFFVDGSNYPTDNQKKANEDIKVHYQKKEYEKCIECIKKQYWKKLDDMPDDILYIAAESCLHQGKKKILKGAFESGLELFRLCREYSDKCTLSTDWIDANIFIFEAIVENSDCPIQSLDKDYFLKIRRSTGYEYYNYFYAIRLIDDKRGDEAAQFLKFNKIIEPAHKEHINAKFMLLSENKQLQNQALDTMREMIKKAPSYPLDAITRYLILKDIEYAARSLDNYETAYKYATMRLKIISEMRD